MSVPQLLLDFIASHETFAVVGHLDPDGDCISSQLVLASALERLGKSVIRCSPGPFDRREIAPYAPSFVIDPAAVPETVEAAIVVDCSSPDRIAEFHPAFTSLPIAVIDHHTAGDETFGNVRYVDPEFPAATLLILELLQDLEVALTPEESSLLFLGFATDTGFFRYLDSGHARFIRMAADLVAGGASPRDTYASIFHGKPKESRFYLARALDRTEFLRDGRIALTYQTVADARALGRDNRDSDAIYASLLSVDGVELIAVVKEDEYDGCTVSFRSTGIIDVGTIALEYGGGGHRAAAGCRIASPLSHVLPRIRERIVSEYSPTE